jgi:hypothetical protein
MRNNFEPCGEMNYSESLEQAQGGHGRVQIQTRRKTSAEDQAESFDRVHAAILAGQSGAFGGETGIPGTNWKRWETGSTTD